MNVHENKPDDNNDSDEEDCGNYFLQPASSPYNITQKVKEANVALFSDDNNYEDKEFKVKFKENLVDFEPELSYDDASSIESEEHIDYSLIEQDTSVLESQLQTALILNVCNGNDKLEEIEEEIAEEIQEDFSIIATTTDDTYINLPNTDDENSQSEQITELELTNEEEFQKTKPREGFVKAPKTRFRKKTNIVEDISCKRHCIDSIDRFDFNANISVSKINLREKPYDCPRLKLQRRNCCEKNEVKIQQKLPCYSGLRSEYGLTAAQLEKRERRKEILKLREQERQRIIEENKRRRIQQNEQIFCEWLKSVSARKTQQKNSERIKPTLSSTIITFPNKMTETAKQRPKTANENVPKRPIKKKRPHTTSTCIFIEVPQSVLKKGISIGDLLVTKSSKLSPKKLHVLAVS